MSRAQLAPPTRVDRNAHGLPTRATVSMTKANVTGADHANRQVEAVKVALRSRYAVQVFVTSQVSSVNRTCHVAREPSSVKSAPDRYLNEAIKGTKTMETVR